MNSITNGTNAHKFRNLAINRRIIELVDRKWNEIFRFMQIHKCGHVALTTEQPAYHGYKLKCIEPMENDAYYTSAEDAGEVTRVYFTIDNTRNQLIDELVLTLEIP